MTEPDPKRCATCRHHSKETKPRFLGLVFDDDAELETFHTHDGSPDDVATYGPKATEDHYTCMAQEGKPVGKDDEAGVGCSLWQAPAARASSISDAVLQRIAAQEERFSRRGSEDDGDDCEREPEDAQT